MDGFERERVRDQWAMDRYGDRYVDLCGKRQEIIDDLIEQDRKIKASTAVPKEMLDGKEPTAAEVRDNV